MSKRNGRKKNKGNKEPMNKSWGMAALQGARSFLTYMPEPRTPMRLATPSLSPVTSVYPRKLDLDVPLVLSSYNTASGGLAVSYPVGSRSAVYAFGSRFASLFKEWCVVGADLEVRINPGGTTPQGFVAVAFDEIDATNPTAAIMQKPHAEVGIVSATTEPVVHHVKWQAMGYNDLQWVPTSGDDILGYLKLFASTGDTYTASGTGVTLIVTGTLACAFRGYT
jgi:hypothetical protein